MSQYQIESLIQDYSLRMAVKNALAGDGALSDAEVSNILLSTLDGKGVTKQEFEDLQMILKESRTLSDAARGQIQYFAHIMYTAPIVSQGAKPTKPAAGSKSDLTANFSLSEFACSDGTPVPDKYYNNCKELAENLQVLRDDFGAAISLNCGYRTPTKNKAVGGVSNSQHLLAKAADIRVKGQTPNAVADRILKLIGSGKMKQGGLGRYNTFTHYDIRGKEARWDKRT